MPIARCPPGPTRLLPPRRRHGQTCAAQRTSDLAQLPAPAPTVDPACQVLPPWIFIRFPRSRFPLAL